MRLVEGLVARLACWRSPSCEDLLWRHPIPPEEVGVDHAASHLLVCDALGELQLAQKLLVIFLEHLSLEVDLGVDVFGVSCQIGGPFFGFFDPFGEEGAVLVVLVVSRGREVKSALDVLGSLAADLDHDLLSQFVQGLAHELGESGFVGVAGLGSDLLAGEGVAAPVVVNRVVVGVVGLGEGVVVLLDEGRDSTLKAF